MKIFSINTISIFGYLVIGVFFPLLWFQGMRLKREVSRFTTPGDSPYGICKGKDREFNILGLGESPMAGVGIAKHTLTLTGLTAGRLNKLLGCSVNWKILAGSGLSMKNLNKLIREQSDEYADLVLVSMGGNDVFQLTPPWVWKKNIKTCVKLLFQNYKNPLILFSPVPPVGRFPAIPNPLKIAFGFWEFLLQASLAQAINSMDNAYLLDERYPDGKKYYLEDGIHPSRLAYDPWSEKLAIMAVELLNQKKLQIDS
mgnify:FL=1